MSYAYPASNLRKVIKKQRIGQINLVVKPGQMGTSNLTESEHFGLVDLMSVAPREAFSLRYLIAIRKANRFLPQSAHTLRNHNIDHKDESSIKRIVA